MKLDEYYTVEHDTACWTLTYEKLGAINPKTDKPKVTRDVSYHANLRQALARYLDESLKGSKDLRDIMNRICEVEKKIDTIGNPANVETVPTQDISGDKTK